MRLSTRLLLPLVAVVVVVMSLYGSWALRQQQTTLETEARRATYAYATALGLALGGALESPRIEAAQEIIDRISQEPEIYGVLVYGDDGRVRFSSDLLRDAPSPPQRLQQVLRAGTPANFERLVGENRVYSVIRPLRSESGALIGAYEVAQPLFFVEEEKRQTRGGFLLITITLVAAVSILILWLVRRMIGQPLEGLVLAVHALGRGELGHRIPVTFTGGELGALAGEFNRMADRLESARTELLVQTEERLTLEQRLRQTEKMAAIGRLAAGLAHEIAAPLNVVAGRAEILRRREMPREVQERNLRIIVDQIGRITIIVRNLLDFARRREPRLRPHDLAEDIQGVLDFLEGEFERVGIEVRTELEDDLWVLGDPHLLHQVFINLLLNAIHALDQQRGTRSIRIRGSRSSERLAGRSEFVSVEVCDSGPGIDEANAGRIFEPFFTTKSGGEGTGLGLAVAQGILEEHGGSIEVADAPGGGACFRLTIPAVVEVVRA